MPRILRFGADGSHTDATKRRNLGSQTYYGSDPKFADRKLDAGLRPATTRGIPARSRLA